MLENIKSWIIDIVIIVCFSVIIDMVLPKGNIKKYAKFIMGIIIIVVIISPIIDIFKQPMDLDEHLDTITHRLDIEEIKFNAKNYEQQQMENAVELFKRRLHNNIQHTIERNHDVKVVGIDLDMVEDPKDKFFGEIKEIRITIDESSPKAAVETVSKVEITSDKNKPAKDETAYTTTIEKEILETMYKVYGIDGNKIKITQENL
ncbi:MAG TPA: stage III sporulation protein AF [Clostridiales bacterium]|nr:stage III sporulation protein AF [Clostridiales bacterium]